MSNATDKQTFDLDKLAAELTEEEAKQLWNRLRYRHDWLGTFWSREDVQVEAWNAETESFEVDDEATLTDAEWNAVRSTYGWRKGFVDALVEGSEPLPYVVRRSDGTAYATDDFSDPIEVKTIWHYHVVLTCDHMIAFDIDRNLEDEARSVDPEATIQLVLPCRECGGERKSKQIVTTTEASATCPACGKGVIPDGS